VSYGVRPVGSTLLGIVILLPTIALATIVMKALPHPVVQLPVTGALLVVALLCLIGSAGLALAHRRRHVLAARRGAAVATTPARRPGARAGVRDALPRLVRAVALDARERPGRVRALAPGASDGPTVRAQRGRTGRERPAES
jgi:hypothetical protein